MGPDKETKSYFPLSMHFVTQVNPAFCGPASISMVLNAHGVPRAPSDLTAGFGLFDQDNVFTPRLCDRQSLSSFPAQRAHRSGGSLAAVTQD